MDNSEVVTLNEICRVCLMKSENMKQLLDPCDEVIGLISKLSTILNSEIEISDTLPSFLCRNCEEKLKVSYEFNRMCHKSHQFILTCLSAPNANQKNTEIHKVIQCDNNACESSSNQESENSKPVQENEKFFTEVCKKSRTKQVMKLTQYSLEDVNKAIQEMRQKYIGTRDCLYCSFSSKDSRSLSIHMTRLHWKYKDKWCSKCNQTEQNLSQHVQNEHKDDFKCPFCGKETSNTSHFMEHLASHTVEREFVCNECDKRFISVRHLKAHSKVHNTAEEYCHICLVRVSDKELLSEHLTSRKKQRCNVCERIFDKNHYETHTCFISGDIQDTKIDNDQSVIDLHPASALRDQVICSKCNKVDNVEVRNYGNNEIEMKALCTFCGKQFRTRSKLSVHLRIHTGEAPYKCSYCDTRVATRSHLVVHERIHTGEKPHVCKVCGKGFAQASVLKTHTKIHTGRTEHCLLCPKKFCRPSELKQHMRKHTGEKPYPCTYCDKAFTQRSHLVEHSLTHSDIRPYTCEYCHKGFKKASTLKSHLNVHLENKSFKCTQCLYESQYSYLLNEHMIQHINSQPQTGKAHTCELCNESFTASDLLNLHCSTHHSTRDVKMNLVEVNEGEQFEILEQSLET